VGFDPLGQVGSRRGEGLQPARVADGGPGVLNYAPELGREGEGSIKDLIAPTTTLYRYVFCSSGKTAETEDVTSQVFLGHVSRFQRLRRSRDPVYRLASMASPEAGRALPKNRAMLCVGGLWRRPPPAVASPMIRGNAHAKARPAHPTYPGLGRDSRAQREVLILRYVPFLFSR